MSNNNIRTITIKKTELAMYKGLGQTNSQIAKRLGISPSEVQDALVTFNIVKGKSLKKDYRVEYINDMDAELDPTTESTEEVEYIAEDSEELMETEV